MKLDQAGLEELLRSGLIVFIDGECNLCHGTVQFTLRYERAPAARFAALQEFAPLLARKFPGFSSRPNSLQTVAVVDRGQLFTQSSAVLRLAREYRFPWGVLARMAVLVPAVVRDQAYDFVARNRYAWFGKKDSCVWNPSVGPERIVSFLPPTQPT